MPTINFMGDVMFGELLENFRRGLRTTLERDNIDPFEFAAPFLGKEDLNVINLETVFSDSSRLGKPFSEILISTERSADYLADNNINIVNTANNHALDHGKGAFERSLDILKSRGITVIGYRKGRFFQKDPEVIDSGGLKIGFLGYNISNFPDSERISQIERIREVIRRSREGVDKLVISMHWGEEYTNIPPPFVVKAGREILEEGADIIHGHHSHQIQGVIQDGDRVFAPSLGNFIFDQKVKKNRITAILRVEIGDSGELSHRYIPFYMNSRYQPENTPGNEAYLKEINDYLAASYGKEPSPRLASRVKENVRKGHRGNRIRMRVKMLAHFWDYLPYLGALARMRSGEEKMFSVIEAPLPGAEDGAEEENKG